MVWHELTVLMMLCLISTSKPFSLIKSTLLFIMWWHSAMKSYLVYLQLVGWGGDSEGDNAAFVSLAQKWTIGLSD